MLSFRLRWHSGTNHERAGDSVAINGTEHNGGQDLINDVDPVDNSNIDFTELLTSKARKMDIDQEEELAWIDHIMNTIKQLYTNTGKINEVDADGFRNIDFSEFLALMNTMMKDMDNQEGPAKVDHSLTNNIDFPEFPTLMAREMKDTDTKCSTNNVADKNTETLKTHNMSRTGRLLFSTEIAQIDIVRMGTPMSRKGTRRYLPCSHRFMVPIMRQHSWAQARAILAEEGENEDEKSSGVEGTGLQVGSQGEWHRSRNSDR